MTLIPVHVTVKGLAHHADFESDVRARVERLHRFYEPLLGCRVRIAVPHRHHAHGRHFDVHIELRVPGGGPLVVAHQASPHGGLVAIHDAFDAARRQLEDYAREQRGAVKAHATA